MVIWKGEVYMDGLIIKSSMMVANGINVLRNKFIAQLKKEEGVTAIEYAVIAVAISAMLLAVFGSGEDSFITAITDKFSTLSENIKGTVDSTPAP
jgi:pilus assembly protein Flp/PilA